MILPLMFCKSREGSCPELLAGIIDLEIVGWFTTLSAKCLICDAFYHFDLNIVISFACFHCPGGANTS